MTRVAENKPRPLSLRRRRPKSSREVTRPTGAALVALYNANDGVKWANNTNWLSDRPIGEWFGVTTFFDRRVTRLSLSANQSTG